MAKTWEELVRDSEELVALLKRTEAIDLKIFERLYPDKTHFIYELLQNAEDAKAKTVRFSLTDENLIFEHDGSRLFTLDDVSSIIKVGYSTKKSDNNSIGKFGVGFKAVYAYTNSPEIHSGEFHFRIKDILMPVKEGVDQTSLGPNLTRFLFPFDHPTKTPDKAISEIEDGLRHLEGNTLLFLNNIRRIEFTLSDEECGSLERIEYGNGHIEIRFDNSEEENISKHWLRFQKEVLVTDESDREKNCRIAVAYNLQPREAKEKEDKAIWDIVPLERGQVFIYFPAEKETSNLLFHLHAPFASPADRSSVVDCADNEKLRDELALLVKESLFAIRDWELLNMAFLAVLPLPTDNLPHFYQPIRRAIVETFQSDKLTPTKSGTFAPATQLYRGPARIAEVITNKDLSLLTGNDSARWGANAPPQNKRADYFLDSLKMAEWGWKELGNIFAVALFLPEERNIVESWITKKNDSELMRVYALLGEAHQSHGQNFTVHFPIVRVYTEHDDKHVQPNEAFFPPDQETIPTKSINLVKSEIYRTGRSDLQKNYAYIFLKHIGVRTFDEKIIIEKTLEKYAPGSKSIEDWHFDDIKQFIRYWKKTSDISIFKFCDYNFLLGISSDEKHYWCRPHKLCIDSPYIRSGLGYFRSIHNLYTISYKYYQKLSEIEIVDFKNFLYALGIIKGITIQIVSTKNNNKCNELRQDYNRKGVKWTSNVIDEDYSIENIELYIQSRHYYAGLLIWNALIHADKKVAQARFRPNGSYPIRYAESQLIFYLKTNSWIPDKSGTLHKPKEITRAELPDEFIYDDRNGLLTAIDFGKDARDRDADYQRRNNNAKELGLDSAEKAKFVSEFIKEIEEDGQSFESFASEYRSKKKPADFPERPVNDPERREQRFGEQFEEASEKTSEKRERTVRTSKDAIDPATWLLSNYTNDDGQMICQICKQEMPFKKRDGKPYFESREIFAGKKGKGYLPKEHEAQYLALCPVCAAKYKEFVQGDEQAMTTLKAAFLVADGLEIPITLGEEQTTIRFVETHLLDFKTILKKGQ